MKRFSPLALAAALCAVSVASLGSDAAATPSYELPPPGTDVALATLAADGLLGDAPRHGRVRAPHPRTRQEAARLVAHAIRVLQRDGTGSTSERDLDLLRTLLHAYAYELAVLGIRVDSLDHALQPPDASERVHTVRVDGALASEGALRQRDTVPHTIAGGAIDRFDDAFLTSPQNDDPLEHDPGPGALLRFDAKVAPTYVVNGNLSISLPVHILEYDGPFTANDSYELQPALVINAAKLGNLHDVSFRAGTLDDLESSGLGLAYRAPDATQQGPGFQNPVQPYENGIELNAALGRNTHVQVAWSLIDQSAINTYAASPGANNYFLVVTPQQNSAVQTGAPSSAAAGSHTDTFVASNGAVAAVSLSEKAGVGTVYVSAVNGTVCAANGTTPGGGVCPIPPGSYSYVDATNQVVFRTPLPVGTTVQITYGPPGSGGSAARFDYQYQREHVLARVDQRFTGLPGTVLGLSFSRILDTGNAGASEGLAFGNGYGPESDSVIGVDARIPIGGLTLFGEAASSRYTPDAYTLAPVTDSAAVAGIRFDAPGVGASITYQAVGPDFFSGGTLRYLGPAPDTFASWRGAYLPGFFGFGNDLAINQTFDAAVLPGCSGAACTSRNPNNTYLYPVFDPFVAIGPQFFSAYAPNTKGLTARVDVPLGAPGDAVGIFGQHLAEIVPDALGQLAYGPGFASGVTMKQNSYGLRLTHGIRLAGADLAFGFAASVEQLTRNDKTAYAYVPFNVLTQGADPAGTSADNAYLSGGATPVLFYPNYVNEHHITISPDLTVPLATNLSARLAYDAQTYGGSYGTTLGQNISQRKLEGFIVLTYAIPARNATLSALFGNEHYADDVMSSYRFDQNRESVDYTVRF